MSDIDGLLTAFAAGTLLRPSAMVPNVVDLTRALARLVESGRADDGPGVHRLASLIGPSDHLIFVLADGLGLHLLDALPASSCLVTNVALELQTVFPSTSSTALTSLATGTWPNQHAVSGQWTHLSQVGGSADLLRFSTRKGGQALASVGVSPEQAFGQPPFMARVPRASLALFPEDIVGGTSAAYFAGQRARLGYRVLGQAIDTIIALVEQATEPTYTYLYSPWIDTEAHRHGTHHPAVRAAIGALDRELERLAGRLGGRARIVVAADHGLLDTPVVARHWIRPASDLGAELRYPPSGDARVMYLHSRSPDLDRLRGRLRERYGRQFFVVTTEEAEAIELFGPGPLSDVARDRLGDLMVISAGEAVIEYVPSGSIDRLLSIVAHHSGLTPAEMRVPLVIL